MTVDCTCASSLTREQALKRLAAVEPLPRGERIAAYAAANTNEVWCKGRYPWWERHFGSEFPEHVSQHESGDWPVPANIRAYAAPLRRAREKAKTERMYRLIMQKQRDALGDELDARIDATNKLQKEWDWCVDELMRRDVGAALDGFFTWLSLITRKTPAPCPWCGAETFMEESTGMVFCKSLLCCFNGAHDVTEYNRIAIPAAFQRTKGDGT